MIRWLVIWLFLPCLALAQEVLQVERNLAAIGYDPGVVDGFADAKTKRAVQEFQFGNGVYASGKLTAQELRYLSQMAQLATAREPFVLDTNVEQVGYDARKLGTRKLFANGADFLARWSFGTYSSRNGSLGTITLDFRDANSKRNRTLNRQARALAEQSQNQLGIAILHLAQYAPSEFHFRDTLTAFKTVLAQAEASPRETALTSAVALALEFHVARHKLCLEPGGEVFFPLVRQAVDLLVRTHPDPEFLDRLIANAMDCIAEDQRDAAFQQRLQFASQISNDDILGVLIAWGNDAEARGKASVARQQMRIVADHYASQKPQWNGAPNSDVFEGMIDVNLITLMHRLGMFIEARNLGLQRIQLIEAVNPHDVVENVTAAMGGFDYGLRNSAEMFIETRQFDHFYRLGVYERARYPATGPDAAKWRDPQTGPWYLAVTTLEGVLGDNKPSRQYEMAKIILPQMLTANAMAASLEVSLIQAKAAERLGRFEDAEAAVVRTVSIAQSIGVMQDVKDDVQSIRRALNLSRLSGLAASERLLGQMNLHYADACVSEEAAKTAAWDFPDIDYAALRDDPSVAKALADSDAMNILLGCFFPQRLSRYEVRFVCAVAGLSGRRDVADFLLKSVGKGIESFNRAEFAQACIFGLAHSGRLDWIAPQHRQPENEYQLNLAWYLSLDPQERFLAHTQADMDDIAGALGGKSLGLQYLEKDIPRFERRKLAEKFHNNFAGGFGRIGPSDQDRAEILDNAIGFQHMGFYRAAEIYVANDRRVDPFNFGSETLSTLNDELLRPGHISLRLRYAELYRDWGKPDLAFDAIGPIAEQAVTRLASNADPLPGTVEQWAKRMEPLFAAYLELQFEGLSHGPNYPAIFAIQQYLQLANSTASASVLEQRLNSASPEVARQYQDARRALRNAIDSVGGEGTNVAELSQQLQSIEARLPKSDAALQSHQIGVTRSLQDVVLDLRSTDSAMVVVTQLPDTMILTYLDGQGATARKLDLDRTQAQAMVTAFRGGILGSNDRRDLFDVNQAASLYSMLIGWGHNRKSAPNKLRLVMDGPFSVLPYAALRRKDGWLGAMAELRMSPTVARAATGLRQDKEFRGFVGFGYPNLTEGNLSERTALLGAGMYLPELPETANELTFMAISFGGDPSKDVFTQLQASESQIQALNRNNKLTNISILALATHGLLSRQTGKLDSAGLVLSLPVEPGIDGILTAREIYNYRIGADLVVLSACNTGTPGAGDGLSDLASAFLYAGAGALLLTHWEIDSGAGVEIMKRIAIDQRAAGATDYAASLRRALADLLDDERAEKYHHPRFWASHFILG